MTQYLVAIYRPENYDPAVSEDEAMGREIDALNEEMMAAGVRVFAGGLQPESSARSLRLQPAGKVGITDGPYAETKEHIGGFWVLEAADLDEALAWGARLPSPAGRRSRCVRFGGSTEARIGRSSCVRSQCEGKLSGGNLRASARILAAPQGREPVIAQPLGS